MQFSQVLKELMDKRGLTNYQLAKDLDIHPTTVANWLNGKEPRKSTVLQLSDYFRVSSDYLLGRIEREKPVTDDDELNSYLEALRTRPEMRMLFKLSKGATKEDVENAVKIIEALQKK